MKAPADSSLSTIGISTSTKHNTSIIGSIWLGIYETSHCTWINEYTLIRQSLICAYLSVASMADVSFPEKAEMPKYI